MANTRYTTKQGDRWDTVAYKAYGDASKYSVIVDANPFVPKGVILPAGIQLNIPVLERDSVNESLLPPWKR
jgi:phage tail protein X